jgi:hypothetical protein
MDVKAMRVSVNKLTQSICEELDMRIQVTQNDVQAIKTLVEATWQELEMQLPENEAPSWAWMLQGHITQNGQVRQIRVLGPASTTVQGHSREQQLGGLQKSHTLSARPAGAVCPSPT